MVHNAHSSYENGFIAASNNLPLEEALVAGYRGLMLESCLCDGLLGSYLLKENEGSNLGFCSSFCSSGVRGAVEVLRNVKTFLEANPNEVRSFWIFFSLSFIHLFCASFILSLDRSLFQTSEKL